MTLTPSPEPPLMERVPDGWRCLGCGRMDLIPGHSIHARPRCCDREMVPLAWKRWGTAVWTLHAEAERKLAEAGALVSDCQERERALERQRDAERELARQEALRLSRQVRERGLLASLLGAVAAVLLVLLILTLEPPHGNRHRGEAPGGAHRGQPRTAPRAEREPVGRGAGGAARGLPVDRSGGLGGR